MSFRRALTVDERIKYTQAVNCLMSTPAKFKKYFPVAETRYDDFVALHVNMTEQCKSGAGIILHRKIAESYISFCRLD
jgi:hypothetical protein